MDNDLADKQLNKILLKPRFKIERPEAKAIIVEKFKNEFAQGGSKFSGKIVDHHIVIDVPKAEEHFWSPQLHIEVEEDQNSTIVKGLFGPKPNLWSLFMFIHFGVVLAFAVFLVLAYVRWNLKQDYTFALVMCFVMPVFWFALYFFGRLGRKKGAKQMQEINDFFVGVLDK